MADGVSVCAAVLCLISIVLYVGFDHNGSISPGLIKSCLNASWTVFVINISAGLILDPRHRIRHSRLFKKIIDASVVITVIIRIGPESSCMPWMTSLIHSYRFIGSILAIYSTVTICTAIIRLLGQHTNPSLILSVSFLFFIAIGSLALMLPKSTYDGISYIDSLFVATSAVCITGLTTVDLPATFTPLGITIIAIMMQTGALGVMTFTSFFALFFSGNSSVYSQIVIRDMIYTRSINSLLPTLLYILGFTLLIEALGCLALWASVHGTIGMGINDELRFAAFHSISAFCNAGFSNLGGGLSNPRLMNGNQLVYVVITMLITSGSLGFPIMVNLRDAVTQKLSRIWQRLHHRYQTRLTVHAYTMNSRVVITTWGLLFIAATVLFWVLENDNSLAGMTPWEKLVQSMFNSVTPRSAGFSSVSPATFLSPTLVMIMFLMWAGGASQSTAGGIKVNTLAIIWLEMKNCITGSPDTSVFHRTISRASIRRANSVVTISMFAYTACSLILLWMEPELPPRQLLFESCSALFTVGSSMGITPLLGTPAKILLITAMFIGRVGIISLLSGIAGNRRTPTVRYPVDNIIIN